MSLLGYDGILRIKNCCASPGNRLRAPKAIDIVEWVDAKLEKEPDMWAQILDMAPTDELERAVDRRWNL